MTTEYMVILELITVLIVMAFISVVVWRDKNSLIIELTLINEGLLEQINALESQINEHVEAETVISKGFEEVSGDIDQCLSHVLDDSEENWMQMEYLLDKQDTIVSDLQEKLDSPLELDTKYLQKELKTLKKSLEKSQRKTLVQQNELKTAKRNIKTLKEKVSKLSRRVLSMGGLEIREKRLLRDKAKLKDKFDEVKSKYETKLLSNKKLELELRTSFRAEEVQAIKDELKSSEEALGRALSEKQFLEQEYLSLDKTNLSQEELAVKLERAVREIELLENTVVDMDRETKK
mgnify:FL=1